MLLFIILSSNVCGLGSSYKRKAMSKYIKDFNVIVCFIIESKLSCSDSIFSSMWRGQNTFFFLYSKRVNYILNSPIK
jgi:hypothetical protein